MRINKAELKKYVEGLYFGYTNPNASSRLNNPYLPPKAAIWEEGRKEGALARIREKVFNTDCAPLSFRKD